MTFVGRYINMDASADRRVAMEARLAAAGLAGRYQRFPAAAGRALSHPSSTIGPGELGCFVSHHRCIAEAAGRDVPTHIVEDDVVFHPMTGAILAQVLDQALAQWDVLFCDIIVPAHFTTLYSLLRLYEQSGTDPLAAPGTGMPRVIHYLPLGGSPFTGAASYVVSPAGARRLEPLIAAHLAQGPTMPIDNLLQSLCAAGQITAACAVPFLTSVEEESVVGATTMAGRTQDDLSALALYLMRSQFFLGRDPEAGRVLAATLSAALAGDAASGPLIEAVGFTLSDKFVVF